MQRPLGLLVVLLALLVVADLGALAHGGPDASATDAAVLPGPQRTPTADQPLPPLRQPTSYLNDGPDTIDVAPAPRMIPAPYEARGEKEVGGFRFVCPDNPYPQEVNTEPERGDEVFYGCPMRLQDENFQLGSIALAVNPEDPRQQVFVSLHGQEAEGGPVEQTRQGKTHTAFATWNQWIGTMGQPDPADNYMDDSTTPGGETSHGYLASTVMDSVGNVYAAAGWALPTGEDRWSTPVHLYKMPAPRDFTAIQTLGWGDRAIVPASKVPTFVDRIGLARVSAFDPDDLHQDQMSNGTGFGGSANSSADEDDDGPGWGEIAEPTHETPERIAFVWHSIAYDDPDPQTGYPYWIDAAITNTSAINQWQAIPPEHRIGPCLNMTNPVGWRGQVYVGCVVGPGYDHRPRARVGDIDLWHIDPLTGDTGLVAFTRTSGRHPFMDVTEDGYFVIADAWNEKHGAVRGSASFGWYGQVWRPVNQEIGTMLHSFAGNRDVIDARVTAVAVSEDFRTAFLIYHEWQEPTDDLGDIAQDISERRSDDYRKLVVAFDECQFAFAVAEFTLGVSAVPANEDQRPEELQSEGSPLRSYRNPGTFNDHQDGLVMHHAPEGPEMLHFAVGDYGISQLGAIEPQYSDQSCPVPLPIAPGVPAALPTATSISQFATNTMGATLGILSAAMIGYLLTVKRRQANVLAAEDL